MTRIAPVPSTKRWLIVACDRPLLPGLSAFSNHWVKVSICNLILAESGQRAASCSNGWLGNIPLTCGRGPSSGYWDIFSSIMVVIFMLFIETLWCLYDPVKVHKTNILIEPNYKVCSKSFPWDKKRQLWCLPRLGSLSPAACPRPPRPRPAPAPLLPHNGNRSHWGHNGRAQQVSHQPSTPNISLCIAGLMTFCWTIQNESHVDILSKWAFCTEKIFLLSYLWINKFKH